MTMQHDVNGGVEASAFNNDRPNGVAAQSSGAKRAYQPPRILSRETLEAIAVVCSAGGRANSMDCPGGPINS